MRHPPDRTVPEAVLAFASPREGELLAAAAEHPTDSAAAFALGCRASQISQARARVRRKAAAAGVDPAAGVDHPQPAGQSVRGLSTLYKLEEGRPDGAVLRWVKTRASHEQALDALREAAAEIAATVRPVERLPAPRDVSHDLLACYVFGDPHFGMYADAEETGGASYDTEIATRLHQGALDRLVADAPPAARALIVSVGDLLHADGRVWATSRSGHPLDGDTRFVRVYKRALGCLVWMIDRALEHHAEVRVILASGNHDDASSATMAVALQQRYHDEPRVDVDDVGGGRFHYYRHGACLFGVTHGDGAKAKIKDLGECMSADRPHEWGETRLRHWYTGHIHQAAAHEGRGWTAESLQTLAPVDAWAAANGYRSGRSAKCDVYHRGGSRKSTHYITPEEIEG